MRTTTLVWRRMNNLILPLWMQQTRIMLMVSMVMVVEVMMKKARLTAVVSVTLVA